MSASKIQILRECPRLPKAGRQQRRLLPDGKTSGGVLAGVSVRGALEEDDPETWETHALGWAPKAESEGDRSLGRMRSGSRRAP